MPTSFVPLATAIVLGTVVSLSCLAYRWALPKVIPGIPYNQHAVKRAFGDLPDFIAYTKKHGSARQWVMEQNKHLNSPIVQLWLIFPQNPIVLISDHQEARNILLRRTKEFDHSQTHADVFQATMPNHHISMMTADPRFKGNKELLRDLMSPAFLNNVFAGHIYWKTMNLISLWSLKADTVGSEPFNAAEDINGAAMGMINAAAYALDNDMSATKNQHMYLASLQDLKIHVRSASQGGLEFPRAPQLDSIAPFEVVSRYTGTQFHAVLPRWKYRWERFTGHRITGDILKKDQIIAAEITKALKRLQAREGNQRAAVDLILLRERTVAEKERRQPDYYSKRITDELFGYFIASHETTASAMTCWCPDMAVSNIANLVTGAIKIIADEQAVQQKLRKEIRTAFADALAESRQPSATEVAKTTIPYVDAVMEEILRFRSPKTWPNSTRSDG
ncbi:hypothetical protein S7711_09452 [Stachybotrys chartarum IBT 7711]|uniref:Uncharacterized protein n=1 Tax=Stachybotrys chartarum (strain CBS 109288 / IBT 7711) TaxID=1280523 RepID=A0A084B8S7_STACB|nr:hypothetical protein S7711_09452 [Stachybotrys chartarum IBT 7711]